MTELKCKHCYYKADLKKHICQCGKSYTDNSTLSSYKKKHSNLNTIKCLLSIKNQLSQLCQEDMYIIWQFIDHFDLNLIVQESDMETLSNFRTFKSDINENKGKKIPLIMIPKSLEQRLVTNTLSRMSCAFEKRFKPDIKYLGCSINKLQYILEKQFWDGMNWNNYGTSIEKTKISTWQIDHIIPCNVFDFNNPIHRYACFHYKNLQPLWTYDNLGKGKKCESAKRDNYIQQFIELYIQ
jgi:hypothetical protein